MLELEMVKSVYPRIVIQDGNTYLELYSEKYGCILFYDTKKKVFSSTHMGNFPDITPLDLFTFAKFCGEYTNEV